MFKKFKQYKELLFLIITLLILVILQKVFFNDENMDNDSTKEGYEEDNESQEIPEDFSNPGQYQLFCKGGRGNFGGSLEYPTFMRTGTCEQCL